MITTISPQIVCLWIVSTGTTYWVCKVLNVHFFPPLSCNFYVEILSKTLAIVMTTSFYTAISIFPLGGLCRNWTFALICIHLPDIWICRHSPEKSLGGRWWRRLPRPSSSWRTQGTPARFSTCPGIILPTLTHINKDVVYWGKHPVKLILSWWPHDVAVAQVSLRANFKISSSTFSYSRTRRVSVLNGKHIIVDWCVLWSNLSSFLLALPDAHLPSCHVLLALMLRVVVSKETIILTIN